MTSKVLLLGDGNFSFSLSLSNALELKHITYRLICTSFDNIADIIQKYPESGSILNLLEKR